MDLSVIYDALLYVLALLLLVAIVQGFLSSRKRSYLGLILPLFTFVFSLYAIYHFKDFVGDHGFDGMEAVGWYALQFFVGNIPTFILLVLYSMFKYDKSKNKEQNSQNAGAQMEEAQNMETQSMESAGMDAQHTQKYK